MLFEHLEFFDRSLDPKLAYHGSYNLLLVTLSILVACMAAYSALRIVGRIQAAPSRTAKALWLTAGALTMGIGVWAMHFVGMLAFILPIPVSYDYRITLLSMLPSVLASGVMLSVISSNQITSRHLLLGGILMGAGIGIMHYTGMAAMETAATMLYDLHLFIASIVVAVILACTALHTKFFLSRALRLGEHWIQLGAAFIMGIAVAGMHYTGMAAVYFFPPLDAHAQMSHLTGASIDPLWLGAWVTLISVLIIGITIFVTMLDHRLELERRRSDTLESLVAGRTYELQEANDHLEVELEQRRQAQEALRIAKEAAEAAALAKAEFLANMSHEIRTPLNAIVGMAELLMDTPLKDEQRDFTSTIRTSSDSLINVINDILDFSKIEAHKLELENQPFDLRQCVEEALDIIAIKAAEKNLELAYLAETDVPATLVGDSSRLRQILINLLNNAIKFTHTGEVVVTVECAQISTFPQPGVHSGENTCELHFAVRDTGIGIPAEHMDRLFQAFSQIDASITRKYGGTGLGLIISQRLSELMGGRIWAESAGEDQGSTFHFTIQAHYIAKPSAIEHDLFGVLLSGKRALVVDDNSINRLIVTRQLEAWEMSVQAACSGAEALRWLAAGEQYDFAILDLCMPEMDGFALARALRKYPQGANLPLIMLSSLGDKSIHAEAETLRFAAVLAKPVKQAQLHRALRSLFAQEGAATPPRKQDSPFDHLLAERLPLRILLAEDNLVNQKVAQHTLARLGYAVKIVANGLEALEALQAHFYDVILMDVQMPEMDGFEATRRIIAQSPPAQRPYIIAMTAHALSGDEEKCMEAGMDAYVSKPIQLEKLIAALKKSISPRSTSQKKGVL